MRELLRSARGEERCDLVIKGGRVANVLSMEIEAADVAVKDGIIVGVGSGYEGTETYDAAGALVIPGMIDGHAHIESTLLCPSEFARAVMPLGTTTVMADLHGIASSCGFDGIEFMTREAYATPLDIYFGAPSCVPASPYETPREPMDSMTMMQCFYRELCTHLGEMMNYPGVINGSSDVWDKIESAYELVRTGHAPGVSGRDLCAYMLSGCDCDHECNSADEALEKLRRGMWIMMREGSAEHNIEELIKIVLEDEARHVRCMAVSDDITAHHILNKGHMDHKVRMMISYGVRPLVALAMTTIDPARYFRLYDRGALAPGMIADIAIARSFDDFRVERLWKRGRLVAEGGRALFEAHAPSSVTLPKVDPEKLHISSGRVAVEAEPGRRIRVIQSEQRKLTTKELIAEPKVEDGRAVSDVERDILKIAVMDKNSGSGRIGIGFVNGFGLKRGAIGTSYAHDAHNYVVVGADDESMAAAFRSLAENQGGIVCVDGGMVIASVPLPVGGLMTELDAAGVVTAIDEIDKSVRELGCERSFPFLDLSFMTMTVLPELKITDHGLIALDRGGCVPLFV